MIFRNSAVALMMVLPLPLPAAAPTSIVSLDSVARRVRTHNPELEAARERIQEALGRARQSGQLSNPQLETALENDLHLREWRAEIGFSQRFPVTDRLRLEKDISATDLQTAEAEVRDVERKLVFEAQQTVVEILTLVQRRELLCQQKSLATTWVSTLQKSAEKGEISLLDVGEARVNAAETNAKIHQLDAEQCALVGRLKSFLGEKPEQHLLVDGSLPPPAPPDTQAKPVDRPDFLAKSLNARSAAQTVELEKSRRREDIEAGAFVGLERSEDVPAGYDRETIVGFRLSIPLPWWNNNQGAIDEAKARQRRLALEASALASDIRIEIATARAEMHRWADLVHEIDQTLLPLATAQAQATEQARLQGTADAPTVFRSREKSLQLSQSKIEALRQYHLARVRLLAALGSPPSFSKNPQ